MLAVLFVSVILFTTAVKARDLDGTSDLEERINGLELEVRIISYNYE